MRKLAKYADTISTDRDKYGDILKRAKGPQNKAFDPTWINTHTLGIAQEIWASADFSIYPILADALEDAGCDEQEVLQATRSGKGNFCDWILMNLMAGEL